MVWFLVALAMALVGLVLATRLKAPERGRAAAPHFQPISLYSGSRRV